MSVCATHGRDKSGPYVGVVNAARTVGVAYPYFIFKEHNLAPTCELHTIYAPPSNGGDTGFFPLSSRR